MQIGFFSLLGLVFIVLKLTNVIDWSWWWVTCPFWIGTAVAIFFSVFLKFIVLPILCLYNKIFHKEEYEYMKKMSENRNKTRNLGFIERLQKAQEMQIYSMRKRSENNLNKN